MSGESKKNGKEMTDPASYEVGYGRPPRHSRFKPGQSGNPKGRPKGSKSLKTLLEEALSSPITITEGGVPRKMELRQLLFKAMVGKAVKGDARATAVLVKLMEQFGLSKPDGENGQIVVAQPIAGDSDASMTEVAKLLLTKLELAD